MNLDWNFDQEFFGNINALVSFSIENTVIEANLWLAESNCFLIDEGLFI